MKKILKPKRLSRKIIHESSIVNLYSDKVIFPGGRIADPHYSIEIGIGGVGILIENEQNEILMIRSYRYTTSSIEWEIPGGRMDDGETILETAEREALEETGYTTKNHRLIKSYNPIIGISDHRFHIVHCQAVERISDFDVNEVAEVVSLTREKALEMIELNQINDGLSLNALLLLLNGMVH
ncbi:NUDIX hydrolase [bacterium]|nr:NUDIX hydrolase [bacterium]